MYDDSKHRVVRLEIVTERINEVLFIFFRTTDGVQLLEETVVAQEDVWFAARINNYVHPELLKVVLLCRLGLGKGGGGLLADINGDAVEEGHTVG